MPIFEFVCSDCGKPFEELVRSAAAVSEVVCPSCKSPEVKKKVSMFASKAAGMGSFALGSTAAACNTGST